MYAYMTIYNLQYLSEFKLSNNIDFTIDKSNWKFFWIFSLKIEKILSRFTKKRRTEALVKQYKNSTRTSRQSNFEQKTSR